MKNINLEVKLLLDKVYNLKSSDSVIISDISNEQKIAAENKGTLLNEKDKFNGIIKEVTKEIDVLSSEGKILKDILNGINPNDFNKVLDKLSIDFNPKAVLDKLDGNLPEELNKLKDILSDSKNKLSETEASLADVITLIADLDIRYSEAVVNQEKLADYVNVALEGNVDSTRDALINLLSKFNLNKDEQREVAKLLMFPEDGLFQYDRGEFEGIKNGKSFSDVFAEAKVDDITLNNIVADETPVEVTVIEPENNSPVILEEETPDINIPVEEIQTVAAPVLDINEEVDFPKIDKISDNTFKLNSELFDEIVLPTIGDLEKDKNIESELKPIFLNIEDNNVNKNEVDIKKMLENANFNINDFTSRDLAFIEEHFDEALFHKNVKKIEELGMKNDILVDNIELFIDDELEVKLDTLTKIGKVPFDIYLNPNVLVKYDAGELNNSINALKESGLDPKKVPLMAY